MTENQFKVYMADENTIFGVRSDDKVYLGKEVRKEKLKISENVSENVLWKDESSRICYVANGNSADYQSLVKEAGAEASLRSQKVGEVDVEFVASFIADELQKRTQRRDLRPYPVNVILGGEDSGGKHLSFIDSGGGLYDSDDIYTAGDKEGGVYGWLSSRLESGKLMERDDFRDLAKIFDEFDVETNLVEI